MNFPLSPSPSNPNPHSPSHHRSPWSALLSPTPNRPRFPGTQVLATLIRSRNHCPSSSSSPISPLPSPGEDLNNFVWDADGPAGSSTKTTDSELYQIARLYQPSLAHRTRSPPVPICNHSLELLSPPPHHPSAVPELSLAPPLSSTGAFKSSLSRLLRKRTILHLKHSSQSSSATSSPSELSAEHDHHDQPDGDETDEDDNPPPCRPPRPEHALDHLTLPSTPVFQTPIDGTFPPAHNSPSQSSVNDHHGQASTDQDDHFKLGQLPLRSSSILR